MKVRTAGPQQSVGKREPVEGGLRLLPVQGMANFHAVHPRIEKSFQRIRAAEDDRVGHGDDAAGRVHDPDRLLGCKAHLLHAGRLAVAEALSELRQGPLDGPGDALGGAPAGGTAGDRLGAMRSQIGLAAAERPDGGAGPDEVSR